MNKKVSNILIFALKMGITVLILWSIFRKIDMAMVFASMFNLPPWLLLSLLSLSLFRHLGLALVWGWSLQINPLYRPNWPEVGRSYLIGQALRFALPGGLGLVGKTAFIDNSSVRDSAYAFLYERTLVTWALLLFAALSLIFLPIGIPLGLRLALLIGLATFPIWGYFLLALNKHWKDLRKASLRPAPRIVGLLILTTLLNYLQYWLILMRTQPVNFAEVLTRMSLSNISHSIPITYAGLGFKEIFAIHFLSEIGLAQEQIVGSTLMVFIIHEVLSGLVGALIFFTLKKLPGHLHWRR
ncbi:MAG: flippase-like domain-containing protein [Candidatus Syntrophosphaera sp.]|nr:flippase-like domain-containing protein [Candidatus Syntrophosphaera sp.]